MWSYLLWSPVIVYGYVHYWGEASIFANTGVSPSAGGIGLKKNCFIV